MWQNGGDSSFQEDGRFDNNSMFSSPAKGTEKAAKPKCLASVTVKQILECPEEGIKIRDKDVQIVQVIGLVMAVEATSVKIKYVVSDFTGSITGFLYLENEAEPGNVISERNYVVVTGSVRSQGGTKHIMIFSINIVENFNQILEHVLTVIYMPLKLDSLGNMPEEKSIKQEMLSSYGGASDLGYDVDPRYKKVFEIICKSMSESGMNLTEIQSALPVKMPADHIRQALDYLVGEGHIFTTIDEDHFKSIHSSF